jgi:toxin ParE1/3/4
MKVCVSDKADADLIRIFSYVAARNPTAARSIVKAIDDKFAMLSHFPFIGQQRQQLGPGLRGLVSGNYVILNVADPEQVTIVRIIDGRMDVEEEFRR